MTNNQLKLREIREKERSNLVNESIENGKLAETIANNLRNYHVNVSKNEIQRLANNQLNSRELAKIRETVRNDLAKETETNRHNLKEEELTKSQQAINKLEAAYSVGAVLSAIIGLMPDEDIKMLYGKDNKFITTGQSLTQAVSNKFKDVTQNRPSQEITAKSYEIDNRNSDLARYEGARVRIPKDEHLNGIDLGDSKEKAQYEMTMGRPYNRPAPDADIKVKAHVDTEPSYKTSFRTPGANESGYSDSAGIYYSKHGTTSGGTNYRLSGGIKSRGTIVQPR